jgi:hypothetical protein
MAVALAIVSMAATAVIITVVTIATVVIATAALAVAAIWLNDAGRKPEQRTAKNNSQSHCHLSLHQVEHICFFDRAASKRRCRRCWKTALMAASNDHALLRRVPISSMTEARRDRGCELICKVRIATIGGDAALALGSETTQAA